MNDINPFAPRGMAEHVNQGTVNIEQSRAVTEAQGKLILAKKFPRDEALAYSKIMNSCSRPTLAASGEYAYPRGGQTVSGPSIRLAEELARCWGNIEYGIRELSRQQGNSEMEAYAWDLETNTFSSQKFTVRHIRDKKGGGQALTEERDIYELTANMGGRRLRSRLLAILPPDLVEAAVNQCRKTLAGDTSLPIADRVRSMVDKFSQVGVTEKHLRAYLNKSLDEIIPEEIATLAGVFNSIKNGQAGVGDFFSIKATDGESADLNRALIAATQEAQA
ncbi:hypothetical protein VYN29_09700 [Pseudomonas aeruginosa]|uniref:hypothetical protein n=2 Tax=Pseudomonas aeruginosa TaxID=287 RepID=UPI0003BB50FA|nr:hypothetical protein [Pseudomonas aeruginosa]EIU1490493.1 hypothetical protein [Pseudomonas aeruginosa]EIU2786421.1 hypothetical protein [Pseudomonas aeruginosa]EIU3166833.1 hypothetical protein [Pseudomonas aeruginosa]EIU3356740.1 hypothetical protein [Pseudomonas aeruginosa]EIU3385390.1 hypothetical protein [Pseudomonas aeruginosa]